MEPNNDDGDISEELDEYHVDLLDQQAEMEERASLELSAASQVSQRGRGRPPIKEAWTRVISLNDNEAQ